MERKRLRLRNFDYGDPGPYFVTVTLQNRQPIFGTIRDATLLQTAIGCLVESTWLTMSDRFDGVELDDFIEMPDHIHGILILPTNGKPNSGLYFRHSNQLLLSNLDAELNRSTGHDMNGGCGSAIIGNTLYAMNET